MEDGEGQLTDLYVGPNRGHVGLFVRYRLTQDIPQDGGLCEDGSVHSTLVIHANRDEYELRTLTR